MMAAPSRAGHPIDRLPPVRGKLTRDAPLHRFAWFRVGGPADVLFEPADRDDLAAFVAGKPADIRIMVIGVASNLLIRDGGVPGVVIRLGRAFGAIAVEGERVRAGGGALDIQVARVCQQHGVGGLEFLCGVPGTIGGALRMNAGAYGREIVDVAVEAEIVDGSGKVRRVPVDELGYGYRRSTAPEDWIFTEAVLEGGADDPDAIAFRMEAISMAREDSQPIRTRTGGSTFKNPDGMRAWELIDRAGCRGLRMGGAVVSEKHCNFLVNTGSATAADLEALGEEVRHRVREATGVSLEWEIRRIGVPAGEGAA